jgi:hypothetical protein
MSGFELIVTQLVKKGSARERHATMVLHKYEAFARRQNGPRNILLISDSRPLQWLDDERRKEPERELTLFFADSN